MSTGSAALIVGASGGIGAAMLAQGVAGKARLFASSRQPPPAAPPDPALSWLQLDLADPRSIEDAAAVLQARLQAEALTLDTVLICSGQLHGDRLRPERRLRDLEAQSFLALMQVNALGPLLLIRALLPLLPRQQPTQVAAISARVGSIADNRLGGWYSYRCSKAALNMGFTSLAAELRRSHPHCVLTLFHPGTVDSALSRPFQANVPAEKLFSPARAAQQFAELLARRREPTEHLFFDWAGKPVDY